MPEYISVKDALAQSAAIGLPIKMITMLRIGREQGFLHQPRGKGGKCFFEKERFEKFLAHPDSQSQA